MTAIASPLKSMTRRRIQDVGVPTTTPAQPNGTRVLSVSPRRLEDGATVASPPHVSIDDEVQTLLAVASREADRLRSSLDEVAAHQMDMSETIYRLDERLRIGAQMLQAFQHQIERIEHAVATASAIEQRNQRLVESLRELLPTLDAA